MENEQPTALRLAYELDCEGPWDLAEQSSAELRRLYAANQELVKRLQRAIDALDRLTDMIDGTGFSNFDEFNNALDEISLGRSAIVEAEAGKA